MIHELVLLEIKHPIIQAPMAGVTTPEFVAASAEAGILGSIGAGYLSADETRAVYSRSEGADGEAVCGEFVCSGEVRMDQQLFAEAYEALQPIGKQLGMPFWKVPLSESEFDGQVQVVD